MEHMDAVQRRPFLNNRAMLLSIMQKMRIFWSFSIDTGDEIIYNKVNICV